MRFRTLQSDIHNGKITQVQSRCMFITCATYSKN